MGSHRAQHTLPEVVFAAEGVEQLAGLEPSRHRVDREVAPAHVVLERDRRVGDDLEILMRRPGRALGARRRELDPLRREAPQLAVVWVETDADELLGDLEILDFHEVVFHQLRTQETVCAHYHRAEFFRHCGRKLRHDNRSSDAFSTARNLARKLSTNLFDSSFSS